MAIGVDGAARLREIYRRQQELAELAGIDSKKETDPQEKETVRPATTPPSQAASHTTATALSVRKTKSLVPTIVLAVAGIVLAAALVTAIETDSVSIANLRYYLPLFSGPLSLLGIAYLIFRPFSEQESRRFSRMVSSVRQETNVLDDVIQQLSSRVEDNRKILAAQADQLLKVGEQSSERLADIGMNMRAEAVGLQRHTDRLTEATAKARESLGPLLDSLPEARKETENLINLLNDAHNTTSEQAKILASHLDALSDLAPRVENITIMASKNLAEEIERLSHLDKNIDKQLETTGQAVAALGDKIVRLIAEKMQDSDQHITNMADRLDEKIGESRVALDDLAGHLSFNMTARLGEVNEYATRIADMLDTQIQASQTTISSIYTQMSDDFSRALQEIELQIVQISGKIKESVQSGQKDYKNISEYFTAEFQSNLNNIQERTNDISHIFGQNIDKYHVSLDQLASKMTSDFIQRLEIIQKQSQEIIQYFENHLQSGQETLAKTGKNFAKSLTIEFESVDSNLSRLTEKLNKEQDHARTMLQDWDKSLNKTLSEQEKFTNDQLNRLQIYLKKQNEGLQSLFGQINKLTDKAGEDFNTLQDEGNNHLKSLYIDVRHLSDQISETGAMLMNSDWGLSKLAERAEGLSERVAEAVQVIDVRMPAALTRIAEQFDENNKAADLLAPKIITIEEQAANVAQKFDQAGQNLLTQRDKLAELVDHTEKGFDHRQTQIRGLIGEIETSYEQHQQAFDQLAESANTQLSGFIQKLGQLSDLMANIQTQNHGLVTKATPILKSEMEDVQRLITETRKEEKALIASLGTDFSKTLQKQVTDAIDNALVNKVKAGLSSVDAVAEKSVESARRATERLMQQMLTITNITAGIEKRISEAKEEIETHDDDNFTRHVAWLIDALRSKTIDITRLMSADVSDTAWLSYLKGDRGVFSRRAVRLLDNNELKVIQKEYERNVAFREHVNHYIHDFESMLRRVINNRDGTALSVTIMSSDIGKLYAALSQAIQKYRQ